MAIKKAKLKELFDDENYDPLREVLSALKDPDAPLDFETRLKTNMELLGYLYPKMKSIEVEGKLATEFNITIQKFGHLLTTPATLEVKSETPASLPPALVEEIKSEDTPQA